MSALRHRDQYPNLMRSTQAREYLGQLPNDEQPARPLAKRTFTRLVKAGQIPMRPDPDTRTTWFSRDSLDAYLASFTAQPKAVA